MWDPSRSVGIDLYREVAISRIIYLDKWKLRRYKREVKVSSGKVVTLTPEADIIAMVTHLTYKGAVVYTSRLLYNPLPPKEYRNEYFIQV